MKNIVKKHFKKQTGDTIVEVMLAIIVIGGTLGGAFAIANRSTKTTQANYERYQAQVIANNQAELLKQNMKNGVEHNNFGNGVDISTSASIANLKCLKDSGDLNDIDDDCKNRGSNSLYTIQIECLNGGEKQCTDGLATYQNYRIHVEWDSLNGGKDNVELFYGV